MAKILLVEDDSRQLSWARKCLGRQHQLFFENDQESALSSIVDGKGYDLVITDLFIPHDLKLSVTSKVVGCVEFPASPEHGVPRACNGLAVFQEGLKLLATGGVQGVALVSNFEHHVLEISQSERCQIESVRDVVNVLGKRVECAGLSEIEVKSSAKSWNAMFLFDSLHIRDFTHFQSPKGKILTRDEIKHRFSGKELVPAAHAVKYEGYVNLKPYDFVVKALLAN